MADTLANIMEGMKLHAIYAMDGEYYPAVVVTVSSAKSHAEKPVKVSYIGYDEEAWVSVADLTSTESSRPLPPSVPHGWDAAWSSKFEEYYFVNRATKEKQWEVPEHPISVRALVLKPHRAEDSSQLELSVHDIVSVLEKDASGWWGGHKEGKEAIGWFPGPCVREIIEKDSESGDYYFWKKGRNESAWFMLKRVSEEPVHDNFIVDNPAAINDHHSLERQKLGIAHTSLKKLPEAEATYRAALSLEPKNAAVHSDLATVRDNSSVQPRVQVRPVSRRQKREERKRILRQYEALVQQGWELTSIAEEDTLDLQLLFGRDGGKVKAYGHHKDAVYMQVLAKQRVKRQEQAEFDIVQKSGVAQKHDLFNIMDYDNYACSVDGSKVLATEEELCIVCEGTGRLLKDLCCPLCQ